MVWSSVGRANPGSLDSAVLWSPGSSTGADIPRSTLEEREEVPLSVGNLRRSQGLRAAPIPEIPGIRGFRDVRNAPDFPDPRAVDDPAEPVKDRSGPTGDGQCTRPPALFARRESDTAAGHSAGAAACSAGAPDGAVRERRHLAFLSCDRAHRKCSVACRPRTPETSPALADV